LSLDDLQDVDLTIPPTNGQILKYNGTNFIAANDQTGIGEAPNDAFGYR
jgi:hypothetical protein